MALTRSQIMSKYSLSLQEFEALRRRTGERIQRAKSLYKWEDDELPSVNQLIDYSEKAKRGQLRSSNQRFQAILQTPATKGSRATSMRAQKNAAANITGGLVNRQKGPVYTTNAGFVAFSKNIPMFITARNNLEQALYSKQPALKEIEQVAVGKPFGQDPRYTFLNNDVGRAACSDVNSIIDWYNGGLANMYPENALSKYQEFCSRIMEVIDWADENDGIVGS